MMLMAFIGDQSSLVEKLTKELAGSFRVLHVDNSNPNLTSPDRMQRLNRALMGRQFRDRVVVVNGVETLTELDLLREYNATICITSAPLHRVFNQAPILPIDVFVSPRPHFFQNESKRKQYITPLDAFSVCYCRDRGIKAET